MSPLSHRKFAVVGTTGTGKTTLAKRLSQALLVPHIELDALYWQENWSPVPLAAFRERVRQALDQPTWVVDGNYRKARDMVWSLASVLIWLDYPMPIILQRLFSRTVLRIASREELWQGNFENFRSQFLSRDSLFLHAVRSNREQRALYPELLSQPAYAHLKIIRLASPREAQEWLAGIEKLATFEERQRITRIEKEP